MHRIKRDIGKTSEPPQIEELQLCTREEDLARVAEELITDSTGTYQTARASAVLETSASSGRLIDLIITRNKKYQLFVGNSSGSERAEDATDEEDELDEELEEDTEYGLEISKEKPAYYEEKPAYYEVGSYILKLVDVLTNKQYGLEICSGNPIFADQAHEMLLERLFQGNSSRDPLEVLEEVCMLMSQTQNVKNGAYLRTELVSYNSSGTRLAVYHKGNLVRCKEPGSKDAEEDAVDEAEEVDDDDDRLPGDDGTDDYKWN